MVMKYHKPRNVLAGFHADHPDPAVLELTHAGEQWVPADFVIPEHTHPVWEFYLQLGGLSTWRTAHHHEFRCPAGAFFAPQPGLEHWLEHTDQAPHHFLFAGIDVCHVVLERLPKLAPLWQRRSSIHLPSGHSAENAFRQLIREVSVQREYRTEGLRGAIDTLVIEVSRLLLVAAGQASETSFVLRHPAVEQTQQILEQHCTQSWSLNDLGRLTGVSPNHLVRLFTTDIGISPHQYLMRLRLERAKDLLRHSGASVTQIAFDLGFSSGQHFASTFKRMVGVSASVFRQKTPELEKVPHSND
jgi:AraC-like DNA-binding protein